jgi:hypothetical protein
VTSSQALSRLKTQIGHLLSADTSSSGLYSVRHAVTDRGIRFDVELAAIDSRPQRLHRLGAAGRAHDRHPRGPPHRRDGHFMPDLL